MASQRAYMIVKVLANLATELCYPITQDHPLFQQVLEIERSHPRPLDLREFGQTSEILVKDRQVVHCLFRFLGLLIDDTSGVCLIHPMS